jgi:HrpA-like RNA helicase
MDCLLIVPISKAEAWQRSGRAGRQQPGVCYRLYTEQAFTALRESIVPEILRCNLATVVLQLKAVGVSDILAFDFMDRPPQPALVRALEQLFALGALADDGSLTALGTKMSHFPLTPHYSRVLLASAEPELACSEQILTVIAALAATDDSLWSQSREHKDKAAAAKRRFASQDGGHSLPSRGARSHAR